MRDNSGPQYHGDPVTEDSVTLGNREWTVRDLVMENAAPGAVPILIGDAVELYAGRSGFFTIRKYSAAGSVVDGIVGGSLDYIPVGGRGRIRVAGFQDAVSVATVAGDGIWLKRSAAVDGQLAEITTAGIAPPVAWAPFGASGGRAVVRWLNPLNL
jgi:hypothetical protein